MRLVEGLLGLALPILLISLFSRKGSVMLDISGCVFCNNKAIKARLQKCEVGLEITVWRRIQINITSL